MMHKDNQVRLEHISSQINSVQSAVPNQFATSKSELKCAYYFFGNPKVTFSDINEYFSSNLNNINVKIVFLIQDTTEINLNSIKKSFSLDDPDIGYISDNRTTGYYLHTVLAYDPELQLPLGIANAFAWARRYDAPNKTERNYQNIPIEEKESNRWLLSIDNSIKAFPPETKFVVIADREADIFEAFAHFNNHKINFVIRGKTNRTIETEENSEFHLIRNAVAHEPLMGTYKYEMPRSGARKARTVEMEVRFISSDLKVTKRINPKLAKCRIGMVHVVEKKPPEGEKPIEWYLYTSFSVSNLIEALRIVEIYRKRWMIEETFRILKTEGLQIESSQLSRGSAHQKLGLVALQNAVKILILKMARWDYGHLSAEGFFTSIEIKVLKGANKRLEGKTAKQKNPFPERSLSWSVWIIARLGGWKGIGLPGVITFSKGIQALHERMEGYLDTIQA